MWVKKTEQEIVDSRKRLQREGRVAAIGLWLLFTLVGASFPGYSEMRGLYLLPVREILQRAPVVALTMFPVLLVYWFWWGNRRKKNALNVSQVCLRCGATKLSDGVDDCPCGGAYVNMDEAKWVREPGEKE